MNLQIYYSPILRFHMDYKIIGKNSNGYINIKMNLNDSSSWLIGLQDHRGAGMIKKKIEMESSNLLFFIAFHWIIISFKHHFNAEMIRKKKTRYSWICWNFIVLPSNVIIVPWIIKLLWSLLLTKRLEKVEMCLQICYFSIEFILHRS